MTQFSPAAPTRDPLEAILLSGGGVLAVITGVDGPSYRPLGAMMAFLPDGTRAGTLSSGCIEADLAIHAQNATAENATKTVLYGVGSPFVDIQLPCGGGLQITLIPRPDLSAINDIQTARSLRISTALALNAQTGTISASDHAQTGWDGDVFNVHFPPQLKFLVFGKGPEASTFSGLVQSAGYPIVLLSQDDETLQFGHDIGVQTRHLTRPHIPADMTIDDQCAVILFFHDHDWEPQILKDALTTPAFYIGSQGSQRARDNRLKTLLEMGVSKADLDRLFGPVGLIPSVRDPRTLAVSVLAEILKNAGAQ